MLYTEQLRDRSRDGGHSVCRLYCVVAEREVGYCGWTRRLNIRPGRFNLGFDPVNVLSHGRQFLNVTPCRKDCK
jgi:hypothetical protein